MFELSCKLSPQGDQPLAIETLSDSINKGNLHQTLLGVTGSGKTFTVANIIQKVQKPTLVISHNKTLAAQLYSEFKSFFPKNAVEYFVSYYDYYQPEAYLPQTDTYIEKDSSINSQIERLRLAATTSLMSRKDVIIIASVSCIYGLGSPEDYREMTLLLVQNMAIKRDVLIEKLTQLGYERNNIQFACRNFRVKGDTIDIFPAYMESAIRVELFGDILENIYELDPISGKKGVSLSSFCLYPASPYITNKEKLKKAITTIRKELDEQVSFFEKNNKLIEAQRLRMRTEHDIEMLQETGFCSSIENYSRHLTGRPPGERPYCLFDFFPKDFLLVVDESHVSIPQIRAMYNGDYARKRKLVDFGFRLPSALDNRPLRFEEFLSIAPQTLYVSATPSLYELDLSSVVAQQIIRPTGLLDPIVEIRPIHAQVEDLIGEIRQTVIKKERVLVITLTKAMAEDIASYLRKEDLRVEYLHSDIDTIERVEILKRLCSGQVDVLVGINLLREGLDLPAVSLVGILDADKEGFLRSQTSLIQIAGRAARHEKGRVILYADQMTGSIQEFLKVTEFRRKKQAEHNKKNNIIPRSTERTHQESLSQKQEVLPSKKSKKASKSAYTKVIQELEEDMQKAAKSLQFEKAAVIRDQIASLKKEIAK